jgi:hypothetical protein
MPNGPSTTLAARAAPGRDNALPLRSDSHCDTSVRGGLNQKAQNKQTNTMQLRDIGYAVAALKSGKRVRRAGWNGEGMFLFLLPAGTGIPTRAIHDPALRAVIESEVGGDSFDALSSVRMFTSDKKVLTGWLASQTDLLAEDWEVVE